MKLERAVVLLMGVTVGCTEVVPADSQDPPVASATCIGTPPPDDRANALVADPSIAMSGPLDQPLYVACRSPAPVSGGTLALLSGHRAAVSDPDHQQIFIVDLDALRIAATVSLHDGDQPGRIAEDAAGRVHVALRNGFALSLDPTSGMVLERRAICAEPRGIAYEAARDLVHVACAEGELVSLPASGGGTVRHWMLDSDLRDVIVEGGRLLVSRFRSAELLVVESDGSISRRITPPTITEAAVIQPGLSPAQHSFSPAVAWRTIAAPGGGVLMTFQEEQTSEVTPTPGGYGGVCGGVVRTSVALLRADGSMGIRPVSAVLPVDLAVRPDGMIDVVSGAAWVADQAFLPRLTSAFAIAISDTTTMDQPDCAPGLLKFDDGDASPTLDAGWMAPSSMPDGQLMAIAYDELGRRIVQTREPYSIAVDDRALVLPGESMRDSGHDLFHFATSAGLACASCHPEGREDGHVWNFSEIGPRRTQSIAGGILGTEPFHWGGDMNNFSMLAHDVMGGRMAGPALRTDQLRALATWVDRIPAPSGLPGLDPVAVERGRNVFGDPNVGCTTCHTGDKLTNNQTVNVGTNGAFQVPSLIGVGWRAPYLHNGCAPTLEARFGDCGGGDLHGHTSILTDANRTDLVTFLKSL
jgi:hypothetical protein